MHTRYGEHAFEQTVEKIGALKSKIKIARDHEEIIGSIRTPTDVIIPQLSPLTPSILFQKANDLEYPLHDSAIAEAAARVRAQVMSSGICDGQSGTGASILRVLIFPLPNLIPPTAPHSSPSIIRGCYNRPNSGRSTNWTSVSPHPKKLKTRKPLHRRTGEP
jgi:hypothetical protein